MNLMPSTIPAEAAGGEYSECSLRGAVEKFDRASNPAITYVFKRSSFGSAQELLQSLDYADERILIALPDKAVRVQAYLRFADRVAFVPTNTKRGTAVRALPDLDDDD